MSCDFFSKFWKKGDFVIRLGNPALEYTRWQFDLFTLHKIIYGKSKVFLVSFQVFL